MAGSRPPGTPPPPWIAVLPNLLTAGRLGLAAGLPFAPRSAWLAMVLAAGASDFLDGFLARRLGAMTRLGAWLDGVADKVFVLAALLTLATSGEVAWWQVPLVLARDLAVLSALLGVLLQREWRTLREAAPRWAGKLTTALVFLWFVTVLLGATFAVRRSAFVLAAAASLWAAFDYIRQAQRLAGPRPRPRAP